MKKSKILKTSVCLALVGVIAGYSLPVAVSAFTVEDNLNDTGTYISAETPENTSVLWIDTNNGNSIKYHDNEKWVRLATEVDVADLKKLLVGDEGSNEYDPAKDTGGSNVANYNPALDGGNVADYDENKGLLGEVKNITGDEFTNGTYIIKKDDGTYVDGNGNPIPDVAITDGIIPSIGDGIKVYDENDVYNPGDIVYKDGALNIVLEDGTFSTDLSNILYTYLGEYAGPLNSITDFDYDDYIATNGITEDTLTDIYYFMDENVWGRILVTVDPHGATLQVLPAMENENLGLIKKSNGKFAPITNTNTNLDTLPDVVLYRDNITVTDGIVDWGDLSVRRTDGTDVSNNDERIIFTSGEDCYEVIGGGIVKTDDPVRENTVIYNTTTNTYYQITINPQTGDIIATPYDTDDIESNYYKAGDIVRKDDGKYYYLDENNAWQLIGDSLENGYTVGTVVRKDDGKYYVYTYNENTDTYTWELTTLDNAYNVGDTAWIDDELKVYTYHADTNTYTWETITTYNEGDTITRNGVLYIYKKVFNTTTNAYEYKWEETSTIELLQEETENRKAENAAINTRIDEEVADIETWEGTVRDYGALSDTHNKVDIITGLDENGKLTNKNVTEPLIIVPADWEDVTGGTWDGYKKYSITDARVASSDMIEVNYRLTYLDIFRYETDGDTLNIYTRNVVVPASNITVENIIFYYNVADSEVIGD